MEVSDYFSLGAVLVALFALIWQVYISNQQSMMATFLEYTKRYQDIKRHLPALVESENFTPEGHSQKEEVLKWVASYFDMCSEEFYLNKSGLVNKKVWKLWDESINRTVPKYVFKTSWQKYKLEENYDDIEFKKYINKILEKSL